MAKLYWLKSLQPCKLELRPLVDYAGQPLVFTNPGTSYGRRCVTEEVRNSALVERYLRQQIIADENAAVKLPPAAPVVVKVESKPVMVTESLKTPEPVTVIETEIAPPTSENLEKTESVDNTDSVKNFPPREGKRGRGR